MPLHWSRESVVFTITTVAKKTSNDASVYGLKRGYKPAGGAGAAVLAAGHGGGKGATAGADDADDCGGGGG
jgi:hypothetical protein